MFRIITGGHNSRHAPNFKMTRPRGIPEYLLLLIKSAATFVIAGTPHEVKADSFVLIDRHTPYSYGGNKQEYVDDWLHFDCEDPSVFPPRRLTCNTFFTVTNQAKLSEYFEKILFEQRYTAPEFKQANTSLLLQVLLNHLILNSQQQAEKVSDHPYYYAFQKIRLALQLDPYKNVTAEQMARELHISLSHFQHLYQAFFAVSFQKDLIASRISYAKKLLGSSELSVAQVADYSGYRNEVHFFRQFKQITGQTPTQFRKAGDKKINQLDQLD